MSMTLKPWSRGRSLGDDAGNNSIVIVPGGGIYFCDSLGAYHAIGFYTDEQQMYRIQLRDDITGAYVPPGDGFLIES